MQRGYLRWAPPRKGVQEFRPLAFRGLDVQTAAATWLPQHDAPLSPRDEAVFLLHAASEIEHSLLVQYLYAYFSLALDAAGHPTPWARIIREIAIEEMGHLIGVQNVLMALGGPLTFERETFPYLNPFYPFPFHLEPLSRDSLATYIAAEMPAVPPTSKQDVVNEIIVRATRFNEAMTVNRVGALYERIIELVGNLDPGLFRPDTADTFQADPAEWDDVAQYDLKFARVKTPREAVDKVLRPIAEQGEGAPGGGPMPDPKSHFARFLHTYEGGPSPPPPVPLPLPETNPRYGVVGVRPSRTVPVNPTTGPTPLPDPAAEDNRITGREALPWAQLFNLRYRMLLAYIAHSLRVNYQTDTVCRANLIKWALAEMKHLGQLAGQLANLPRQTPAIFEGGQLAVAGAPFELPYTLNLPDQDLDRWALHLDLIEGSRLQIQAVRDAIQAAGQSAFGDPNHILQALEEYDRGNANAKGVNFYVQNKINQPGQPCQPDPRN
jgi:hypothetical protein